LLADGSIDDWSFGYTIERQQKAAGGINELIELDLLEAGPCVAGANRMTRTLSVKGLEPDRPREPSVPSHVELEARLAREGHIVRIADDDLVEREHDALESVLWTRRNGRQHAEAAEDKAARATTKAAGPVQIARFPC
jgi:hypothetical protein